MTLKKPSSYLRWIRFLSGYLREIESGKVKAITAHEGKRLIKQSSGLGRGLGNYLRKDFSGKDGVLLVCPSPGKGKLRYVHQR